MTLTRDPSARRASHIGEDSSTRRAHLGHDLIDDVAKMGIVLEDDVRLLQYAGTLDVHPVDGYSPGCR